MAGYYSTTRPLVLLNLVISITYLYFGHVVLPLPLTFRSPLDLKKLKQKKSIVLHVSSINLTDIVANPKFQIMRTNIIIANLCDAPIENRTRVITVAGYYSTTKPLVLLNLVISITYSYFGHAVLPKPLTFRFTSRFKNTKRKARWCYSCHL